MATTKAKTIKLTDLADAIDKAVEASAGRRLPGGTVIGKQIAIELADEINPNTLARKITKQVQGSFPGASLTPKVITGDRLVTMGFIIKPLAR